MKFMRCIYTALSSMLLLLLLVECRIAVVEGISVPNDPVLVFVDDFAGDPLGSPPSRWEIEDDQYMTYSIVEDPSTESGRALHGVRGPGTDLSGVNLGIRSARLAVSEADEPILEIDYKIKVIRGSVLKYVVSNLVYLSWRVDQSKNLFYGDNNLGRLEDGWNHIRIVANRVTDEVYFYVNDMSEDAVIGPFPVTRLPSSWGGHQIRFAHIINSTSNPEIMLADFKVTARK